MAEPINSAHIRGIVFQQCNTTDIYFQADNGKDQVNIVVNISNCIDSTCNMVATLYDQQNNLVTTVTIFPGQEKSLSGKNINYLAIQSIGLTSSDCYCRGSYNGTINQ